MVKGFEDKYTNDDDECILAEDDVESDDGDDHQADSLLTDIEHCEA